jgi:DNA-binding MarR family transcriptional regulator
MRPGQRVHPAFHGRREILLPVGPGEPHDGLHDRQRVLGAVEADLKSAGLPPLGWYDILLELRRSESGQLRPLEIEGRLLIAQHNVSRLIDRLEKAGYVARKPCEQDGRGQVVAITEDGRAMLKRVWPVYEAAIQKHVGAKLNQAEAEALARILGQLVR